MYKSIKKCFSVPGAREQAARGPRGMWAHDTVMNVSGLCQK